MSLVTAPEKPVVKESAVEAYLDRLRDVLPPRRAGDVVPEVEALIEDRRQALLENEVEPEAATQRALAALGPPEVLAESLGGGGMSIDLATRRTFARTLFVLFSAHVLLAVVLSLVGGGGTLLPGIVGPLPGKSFLAIASGVLGILFADAGFLLVLYALLGRERAPAILPRLGLRMPGTRRDAALSLVLLGLVALLLHPFRETLLAVGQGDQRSPILAPDFVSLLPVADTLLFLFALRNVFLLIAGGERLESVAADALASLAGVALAVLVLTRDQLVQLPSPPLSEAEALVFQQLLYRVMLAVAFLAGLFLVIRFAKRAMRVKDLLSV
jgi:hypothetical protein